MARNWNPRTEPIIKSERIGRRLFDEPMLMGVQDQPSFTGLDYRHFEETRGDRELSLDRLGRTGIERKAKNYLTPRADAAGASRVPPKKFNGWAHVKASDLEQGWQGRRFPVTPSPIDADGIEENAHHAHIAIDDDAVTAAFFLREIFTRRGEVEKIARPNAQQGVSMWNTVVNLVSSRWKRLMARPG